MKAFWVGAGSSVPVSGVFQFLCCGGPLAWGLAENLRSNALSEDVIITKLTAWVTNAPGGVASWTFTIRDDAADTAAAVTISGTNTTASWSGSVAISAASLVNMIATSGSPASTGSVFWIIEYATVGDFYLMLANNYGTTTTNATTTSYLMPCGAANYTANTTAGFHEGQAPTPFTVTRIAANVSAAPGIGRSRTFTPILNRTTDASFSAVIPNTDLVAVSSPGSLAVATDQPIAIKHVPAGSPFASTVATCLTIVPGITGELAWFSASGSTLSTTTAEYAPFGPALFNADETAALNRFPACTLKKLIASLGVAPGGAGKSRTFTMRSNLVDTALAVSLVNTVSRDVDNVDTVSHAEGNFVSVKHVPVGTPAANTVTGFFFVTSFDQGVSGADTTKFFGFF